MPLRPAVRGVGLSGDQKHGGALSLFRAGDLDLAGVFQETSRGIEGKRRRLGLRDKRLRRPLEDEKRITHRPDASDARPRADDGAHDEKAQRKDCQSAKQGASAPDVISENKC
jgi:hypothetical protein